MPRASAEPGLWPVDRANQWYQAQGWLVGGNYVTSTASNQIEMFQAGTYDPRRINAELGSARFIGQHGAGVSSTICCGRRTAKAFCSD